MRVLVLSSGLPESNRVLTMAPLARQIDSLRSAGVQVTSMVVSGLPKFKYFQTLPPLRRAATEVDLIHAHFGYCGWLARSCRTKPVVVSFMGDDLLGTPDVNGRLHPFSRYVVKANQWLARRVEAVIVKSEEMARVVAPVASHVIPNGVDIDGFMPMNKLEARRRLGWSTDKRYVLFPGNPSLPRKAYPLAKASVEFAEHRIGEAIDLVALWDVAPEQVPLYMNACDAMLMTSFVEGAPNVVKEAMACDLPVVSVPVGDVPELIDGVPGYFVRPRDAHAIGAALESLLTNRSVVEGRQALIAKRLDLGSVAIRVREVYETALHIRPRHPTAARAGALDERGGH